MNIALVTGSAGLIGSEAVSFFSEKFDLVIGIDNNMRQYFFGQEASTAWNRNRLEEQFANYKHYQADIREVCVRRSPRQCCTSNEKQVYS